MTGPRPNNTKNFGDPGWRRNIEACPKGHPYTEENTYTYGTNRQCRACRRERMRERRAASSDRTPVKPGAANAAKTHCPKGHEYTEENTYRWTNKRGSTVRICRTCQKLRRWETLIPRQYGITNERFEKMLKEQDYACAICRTPFPEDSRPVIDHDHKCCSGVTSCGKCVRGLLCKTCNVGIGGLRDSVENLKSAIDYLTTHRVS